MFAPIYTLQEKHHLHSCFGPEILQDAGGLVALQGT